MNDPKISGKNKGEKILSKNPLKNIRLNGTATTVALLLMLTMAILPVLPAANAAGLPTFAYINATPNPVSVGQETLLHIGITRPLLKATQGWEGLTVTVTKPDNTTITLDNDGAGFRTDSTGGTGTTFVPTVAGTYYLQTNFPAQWFNYTGDDGRGGFVSVSAYYEASKSDKLALIVQDEPIPSYPGIPLPTEYWTRPIDSQAREWAPIAGNWLGSGFGMMGNRRNPMLAPFNDGPETAHILWARPETTGGLVGGALDDSLGLTEHSFDMGDAYEGKFSSRFILDGKLYYNIYAGPSVGNVDIYREYACIDLHTGEQLWSKVFMDNLTLSYGQLMYWDTYDFHGVYDYLWAVVGSTWYAFDSFTGQWVYTLTNVPSGSVTFGPKGEFLIYTVDLANGWMTLWNSTNIPELYASTAYGSMGAAQWRPYGKTIDAQEVITFDSPTNPLGMTGYMWNVSIPDDLLGGVAYVYPLDRIIGADVGPVFPGPVSPSITEVNLWGINLNSSNGNIGRTVFENTWQTPDIIADANQSLIFEAVSPESKGGVMVIGARDSRQHFGFSTDTGDYLWVTDPEIYLNWYGIGGPGGERPPLIAYGVLMSTGIGGIVYAYNTTTGERIWTYNATDPYNEFLFGNNWWLYPVFITDGKIYYGSLEHSPVNPMPRGAPFLALDVATGEEVFRVNGLFRQTLWGGLAVIGDSIIATQDTYDLRIYGIGKGPSATTITAPDIGVPLGTSVMIRGTVTDISPGTNDASLTMRFPNGVPAVADESMSDWMLYVYKQFARPTATGVNVTLTVIDPNNNIYDIGTVTSDSTGMYNLFWEPPVPGKYTVIAQFAGSAAYYPSYAETALGVLNAPEATPATPPPTSNTDAYVAGFGIALIIIVIAGLVVIVLMLKRR
jgi:hypothetical protein